MYNEEEGKEDGEAVECLARSIREVELAKVNDPDTYAKALASLKDEAKVISSIGDLKAVAKMKAGSRVKAVADDSE